MLKYDPKLRYSAEECLKHNWFKINENIKNQAPLSKSCIENMKQFKVKCLLISKKESKLEQATITFIITQVVSKEERNPLLSQFQSWDKDGNGVLCRKEIIDGYRTLYGDLHSEEEIVSIMILIV